MLPRWRHHPSPLSACRTIPDPRSMHRNLLVSAPSPSFYVRVFFSRCFFRPWCVLHIKGHLFRFGVEKNVVRNIAKLSRRVVLWVRFLPRDHASKILTSEDLVHDELHLKHHLAIKMNINGTRLRKKLTHQDKTNSQEFYESRPSHCVRICELLFPVVEVRVCRIRRIYIYQFDMTANVRISYKITQNIEVVSEI